MLIETCGRVITPAGLTTDCRQRDTPHCQLETVNLNFCSIKEVNPCYFSNIKSFTVPLQQHVLSSQNIKRTAATQEVNFKSLDV